MKKQTASSLVLTGLLVILVVGASNSIVRADTTWIGSTGSWFTDGNWNNGRPTQDTDAFINNFGTAQVNTGGPAAAKSLTLGQNQGDSGAVAVSGNSIALKVFPVCETTPVPGDIYVGKAGIGDMQISNGASVLSGYGYIASVENATRPASSGKVYISGVQSAWTLSGTQCSGAGLFVGCTGTSNGAGGTALLSVTDGGSIGVDNTIDAPGFVVGLSGTFTGNANISLTGPTSQSQTMKVYGTLKPAFPEGQGPGGRLTILGNLQLTVAANTVCLVTPGLSDNVLVSQATGGGVATLAGRISVTMSGSFTAGTSFTLVHAEGGRTGTFDFESITPPSGINPCFTPEIQYNANDANLFLRPCGN